MENELEFSFDWASLTEAEIAKNFTEISNRTARVWSYIDMITEDASIYKNAEKELKDLFNNDLSASGWISSLIKENEEFLNKNPGALSQNPQKQNYWRDALILKSICDQLYGAIQKFMAGFYDGYKILYAKSNFESAGYDEKLYEQINQDIGSYSYLISQGHTKIPNKHEVAYIANHEYDGKKDEELRRRGYFDSRMLDFLDHVQGLLYMRSFVFETDINRYRVSNDMMVKTHVLDLYTAEVAKCKDCTSSMKEASDSFSRIYTYTLEEKDKCVTDAGKGLAAQFMRFAEVLQIFAFSSLDTFEKFHKPEDSAPFCFMKLPSELAHTKVYSLSSDFKRDDPRSHGTSFEDMYNKLIESVRKFGTDFIRNDGVIIHYT